MKSFKLFSFLSQSGVANEMKAFYSSNKLVGMRKESFKCFIDLIKSFVISSMDPNR